MQHTTTLSFVALALVSLSISTVRAQDTDSDKLQGSLAKWSALKEACGGNYGYFVRTASFAGARTETEITVRNNQVVGRRYKVTGPPVPVPIPPSPDGAPPKPEAPTYKWTEQGEAIGKNKEGAPAKTLDQLYAQAQEVLARKLPEHERRYVQFDKQGLLSSCFTVDTRIADDAPINGVIIAEIRLEPK